MNNKEPNADIKKLIFQKRVCNWKVAAKLGISEPYFYRKLHRELSQEEKERWVHAILEVASDDPEC